MRKKRIWVVSIWFVPLCGLAMSLVSCIKKGGANGQDPSKASSVFAANARNPALLFGDFSGRDGIEKLKDIRALKADLRIMRQVTEVMGFEPVAYQGATPEKMIEETKKRISDAGEFGSVFWYYSGHANQMGDVLVCGKLFGAQDFARVVTQARQTPLQRLVIMTDSCFSGQWVSFLKSLYDSKSETELARAFKAKVKEVLIISATSPNQSAQYDNDLIGGNSGGHFTAMLDETVSGFFNQKFKEDANIENFYSRLRGGLRLQTPTEFYYPASLGKEKVFILKPHGAPSTARFVVTVKPFVWMQCLSKVESMQEKFVADDISELWGTFEVRTHGNAQELAQAELALKNAGCALNIKRIPLDAKDHIDDVVVLDPSPTKARAAAACLASKGGGEFEIVDEARNLVRLPLSVLQKGADLGCFKEFKLAKAP